jgi:hypothetical protein
VAIGLDFGQLTLILRASGDSDAKEKYVCRPSFRPAGPCSSGGARARNPSLTCGNCGTILM